MGTNLLFRRRTVLLGLSCAAAGAVGYGARSVRTSNNAPKSLGRLGPFREVILTEREEQSNVDVALAYPYGERDNPYEEGLAHYLEHLVWQNVRDAGTDGGQHSNAATSPEATVYWFSRAPDALATTVQRLAASAAPLTVDEDFAKQERDIVEREFDLRRSEDPMDAAHVDMASHLFLDSPYARMTMGSKASIRRFTLQAARQLHDQTHHLDKATLHIRGPVTNVEVRRALQRIVQWPIPRAEALPETRPLWPAAPEDHGSLSIKSLSQSRVVQQKSYVLPTDFDWAEIYAARNILVSLALSTKAGGLARPLRYDAFLAASFDLGIAPLGTEGLLFWLEAKPDQDVPLSVLNAALEQELRRLFESPSEASFQEVRDRELSSLDGVLDRLKTNDHRLSEALISGTSYVTLDALHLATHAMSFKKFQIFNGHFLHPRSAVTRLISST